MTKIAIFKNGKGEWNGILGNGKFIRGYKSKEALISVIERTKNIAIDLTKMPTLKERQEEIKWTFLNLHTCEFWKAEFGNRTLATAERAKEDELWKCQYSDENKEFLVSSITALAKHLVNTKLGILA